MAEEVGGEAFARSESTVGMCQLFLSLKHSEILVG